MAASRLFQGDGFLTNDPWLARHFGSPFVPWQPCRCSHAMPLLADADAGIECRELARRYGYASADSARSAVRKLRRRRAMDIERGRPWPFAE